MRSLSCERRWARTWMAAFLVVGIGVALTARAEAQTGLPPGDNMPPLVTFTANGERVGSFPDTSALAFATVIGQPSSVQPVFRTGQPLQLDALALDADGLGFPIFAFAGISTPITYLWNFGGGTSGPLGVFAQRPVVTFELAPGEESRTFTVTLTVLDTTGLSGTSTGSIVVTRSGPPVVNLVVDGRAVPSLQGLPTQLGTVAPLVVVQPNTPVRLGSLAFDESGLGFPIFAGLGNTVPISFAWDFGGGQPANALDVFSESPTVTFPSVPNQRTAFRVSLTVFDATGQSTTRSALVTTLGLIGVPPLP